MMSGRWIVLLALVAGAAATGPKQSAVSTAGGNFCQGCRSLVSFVQVFNSSSQRAEMKELATSHCELYFPKGTDQQPGPCPKFVEAFFYILDNTDAVNHCDQVGACNPDGTQQPSDDIYEYLRNAQALAANKKGLSTTNNVICELCEQLVTQAKTALTNPVVINQVRAQLEVICDYLEILDANKQCHQYLDKYLDQALEFVRTINPRQYCGSVQLCAAGDERKAPVLSNGLPTLADFQNFGIETSVSVGKNARELSRRPTPTCLLCKTVVKEMFKWLRENRTEANIIEGLDQVCALIYKEGPKRDQCDGMVNAYTRELIQLLEDETDPEVICMMLEQCALSNGEHDDDDDDDDDVDTDDDRNKFKLGRKTSVAPQQQQPMGRPLGWSQLISALDPSIRLNSMRACVECKLFIRFLKDKMATPQSRDEVELWLEKNLCNELPEKSLADSCVAMVERDGPVFFQALAGLLDPHAACVQLNVCPARKPVQVFGLGDSLGALAPAPAKSLAKWRGQLCDQCVDIVTQIDDYLSSHPVDQDVSVIIDKVCNKLPEGSTRSECTYIIKAFGAEIVQAIATMDNPRQLCSKVFLCSVA